MVEPFTQRVIGTMVLPDEDALQHGTVVMIPESPSTLDPASWLHTAYRKMNLPQARVKTTDIKRQASSLQVTVTSDAFAHGVHLNVPGDCQLSDQYFDLFAGMSKTIVIEEAVQIKTESLGAVCVNQA